jgi:cysteine desulfurase
VALGAAAAIARRELPEAAAHMAATRGRLLHLLRVGLPGATLRVHGADDPAGRLPNTLSVGIAGVSASALLGELSDRLAASAGAACHSGVGGAAVSPVLRAMGVAEEYALGTLRLSTGRHTTQRDVDGAARLILAYAAAHGVPVCSLGAV